MGERIGCCNLGINYTVRRYNMVGCCGWGNSMRVLEVVLYSPVPPTLEATGTVRSTAGVAAIELSNQRLGLPTSG
jgi:hypothetical protein